MYTNFSFLSVVKKSFVKLLLILIGCIPLMAVAQTDSTVSLSKFEAFTSRSGTMIKSEEFEVSSQKEYKLLISKTTDVESAVSLKAVQIHQTKNMFLIGQFTSGVL